MENRMLEWFKGQVITNIPYDKFSFNLIAGKNTIDALDLFISENNIDMLSVSMRKLISSPAVGRISIRPYIII